MDIIVKFTTITCSPFKQNLLAPTNLVICVLFVKKVFIYVEQLRLGKSLIGVCLEFHWCSKNIDVHILLCF